MNLKACKGMRGATLQQSEEANLHCFTYTLHNEKEDKKKYSTHNCQENHRRKVFHSFSLPPSLKAAQAGVSPRSFLFPAPAHGTLFIYDYYSVP